MMTQTKWVRWSLMLMMCFDPANVLCERYCITLFPPKRFEIRGKSLYI